MFALIDPRQNRVCQIEETRFEVAAPLFWTELAQPITTEWRFIDGQLVPPPSLPDAITRSLDVLRSKIATLPASPVKDVFLELLKLL